MTLFEISAATMAEQSIPARLAEDWMIVTEYLEAASAAISAWLDSDASASSRSQPRRIPTIEGPAPMVIRFDALARLTTIEAASRLERAALAAQQHVKAPVVVLDPAERHLLNRVAAGVSIVDLALEFNYSERSMYRALASLWEKLGVPDRKQGLSRATTEGLLD